MYYNYSFIAADEDYSSLNYDLIITPEQQHSELCVEAVIVDDTVVEYNETFSISLTSNEPGVNVNGGVTIVTILDNDGMLYFMGQYSLLVLCRCSVAVC